MVPLPAIATVALPAADPLGLPARGRTGGLARGLAGGVLGGLAAGLLTLVPAVSRANPAAPGSGAVADASSTPSLGAALKPSTAEQKALAEHLRRSGMQFYGAWWCPACFQQKNLFGQEAGNRLPYVECEKEAAQRQRCQAAAIRAYPTWILGNERREGVQTLEELELWSGFRPGTLPGSGENGRK